MGFLLVVRLKDADLHFAVFDEQCTPINYGQLNKSIYNNEKESACASIADPSLTQGVIAFADYSC
eukprot:6220412-Amphidinium_carterae.1